MGPLEIVLPQLRKIFLLWFGIQLAFCRIIKKTSIKVAVAFIKKLIFPNYQNYRGPHRHRDDGPGV